MDGSEDLGLSGPFMTGVARGRLRQNCDGLSTGKIDGLLRKWLRLLPHPFNGSDRKAGYRYDLSILQAEFSWTECSTGRGPAPHPSKG